MKFTESEKNQILLCVVMELMTSCNLLYNEAYEIVNRSILVKKMNKYPISIAHCSISQLVDLVKKDIKLK
jgi:hypothetical protein